jgi:hypothetical protein
MELGDQMLGVCVVSCVESNSAFLPVPGPSSELTPALCLIYQVLCHTVTASPHLTDHRGGQAALGGGLTGGTPTERGRGFDSPLATQNPHKKKEGFRSRLPPSDRRMGLLGELLAFFAMVFFLLLWIHPFFNLLP